jgi:hypothetical protein
MLEKNAEQIRDDARKRGEEDERTKCSKYEQFVYLMMMIAKAASGGRNGEYSK